MELVPGNGTVVGNRFEAGEALASDALGVVLAARDTKTDKPIFLRVLRPELVNEEILRSLRAEARIAAELRHKSVLATYGVGTTPSGTTYFATEAIDGVPLSQVIAQRKADGGHISLRGAFNVVAHVCKALAAAQDRLCHGTLRPSVVWIGRTGRVKVGDFGIGRVLVTTHGASVLGSNEQACLAPEVKAGNQPDSRSDIFGVGAILYELLTGRSPAEGFVPPSQAHPDATSEVDSVLLRCLAISPEGRFSSPDEVRTALLPLVANAPQVSSRQDFGVDAEVEVDVDLGMVVPPTDPAIDLARYSGSAERPRVGQRVAAQESFRASTVDAGAARASTVDLSGALSSASEKEAAQWMIHRDGLDHGPFSGREIVAAIQRGEVTAGTSLSNVESGDRRDVAGWAEFAELAAQSKRDLDARAHQATTAAAAHADTKSSRSKVVAASVALVALVAIGGIFLATRKAAEERATNDQEVTALYDIGRIQASASGDVLPDPGRHAIPTPTGTPRPHSGAHPESPSTPTHAASNPTSAPTGSETPAAAPSHGGAHASFEDAMNQVVDFGDVSGSGAMTQLTGPMVAEVMNRHIGRIYGACVPAEQARGGDLGRVQIDIAIASDGHVLGASSRQGSPEFKACIGRAVSSVHFPDFTAPRMAARYSFDAS